MPTLSTRTSRLELTVSSPAEDPGSDGRVPSVPWLLAAVGWSAGVAVTGFAAVAVPVVAGWLTQLSVSAEGVLDTMVQFWVSAHGGAATIAGLVVSITPLGFTLLLVAGCAAAGHHAAVQARPVGGADPRWSTWAAVVGVCTLAYAGVTGLLALFLAHSGQAFPVALGAGIIAVLGSGVGALHGLRLDPLRDQPPWLRRLPASVGIGCGVLGLGGVAAILVGLLAHREQVMLLHEALAPDAVGTVLVVVLQLAYWPNLVAWCGSWALGAGISLGAGSVVSPGVTTVGVLPTLPVFGMLPANGESWAWVWMLIGTTAGIATAVHLTRGLPVKTAADLEGWPWQAGLAGVLVGLLWSTLALVSGGDLGSDRLAGLGPRFPDIVWLAAAGVGIAAAAGGLVCHLLAQRSLPGADAEADAALMGVGAAGDADTDR
ncbi:MAG: DUF6350 family protein [Propioniciclava sp.]